MKPALAATAGLSMLLSACSPKHEAPPRAETAPAAVEVHAAMLTQVNPGATLFWDAIAAAQNEAGNLVPAKVDDATWAKLIAASETLEQGAMSLATSQTLRAAAPGTVLQNEENPGSPKAADVQRYLDAKPDEFRKQAAALQSTASRLTQALSKRDGMALDEISNALYENCESCHKAFWYPEQPQ